MPRAPNELFWRKVNRNPIVQARGPQRPVEFLACSGGAIRFTYFTIAFLGEPRRRQTPFASNGSTRIHYRVVGDGLPIVLHSGAAGDSAMWEQGGYVRGLEGYRRVLVDHRGHGLSEKPQAPAAHTLGDYTADVLAILDHLGVYRVAFLGYSDGALVGLSVAAQAPGRIAALALLGLGCGGGEDAGWLELGKRVAREQSMAPFVQAVESEEKIALPAWLRANFEATDPRMFALEVEGLARDPRELSALAPRVSVPTLFVNGALEDPGLACDALASRMRGAKTRVVKIPGAGHVGAFLRAEPVLGAVREFLTAVQDGVDRRYS